MATRFSQACAVAALVACIALGVAACGATDDDAIVLRVGNHAFSKASVDRWSEVISRGGAFSGFRGDPRGSAKQRAIALLISSNWLIGEAARRGIPVAQASLEEVLAEREREASFKKHLRATGQTIAGVKLETEAELASEALREKLAEQADAVTQKQILDFYRQNAKLFYTPPVRITDLLEGQSSASAATALVSRIGTGARFTSMAFHEQVTSSPGFTRTPEKARLVAAIFSARPGVVSQPMPLNGSWAVFVVRRVVPAKPQPFAPIRAQVAARFRVTRQQELKNRFDREFTQFWRARTKCGAAYVGPGCPQSAAPLGAYEDPFSMRAHPLLSEQGVGA